MKIVHVYANNLQIFCDALDGTGCCVNGSQSVEYLMRSISSYNSRDVLGLIVFRKHLTKKILRLIKEFDELFVFTPLPIIVACDDAHALFAEGKLKVSNAPLFLVDSVDGTISDIDLQRILATLSIVSETMYDLNEIGHVGKTTVTGESLESYPKRGLLAPSILEELAVLRGEIL